MLLAVLLGKPLVRVFVGSVDAVSPKVTMPHML
jgi:hypothetical protein